MARPQAKLKTENARPEQAAVESLPPDSPPSTVSKAEAVRQALAAGKESPDDGVGFIKSRYGIDITNQTFSSYKAQQKARDAKQTGTVPKAKPGRKPKAAAQVGDRHPTPPPKPWASGGESDLLAAMEAMKPLVASLGKEQVKRIVDLLG